MANIKVYEGENPNVLKYVFDFEDAIAEAVVYKYPTYEERTVLCISVQSGCPVGCQFCGTGKKFIRDLNVDEIMYQVEYVLKDRNIDFENCKKFQIMFMSMGEPMLNWIQVQMAVRGLGRVYPNSQLLLSTVGIANHKTLGIFVGLAADNPNVGLQFSIHNPYDQIRNKLIPFPKKLTLKQIASYGKYWNSITGRQVYLNYCVNDDKNSEFYNSNIGALEELMSIFDNKSFAFTFSVISDKTKGNIENRTDYLEGIQAIDRIFISKGYNTRVFDPAGQDDIGAGCGQLWHTQEWMKNHG